MKNPMPYAVAFLCAAGLAAPLAPKISAQVELISRAATISDTAIGELPGAGFDLKVGVSTDGRFVAYSSASPGLAAGQIDANDGTDVFLWDRTLGSSTLVSHAAGGATTTAAGASGNPDLSANGRYLVFLSRAGDLVAGVIDGNSGNDVYLWDRTTGTTVLVSHLPGSPTTTGNGPVFEAAISGDGAFVAFASSAANLVVGQADSNGDSDVFLWERATGTVTLVSHVAGMAQQSGAGPSSSPAISGTGGKVAFASFAADLVAGQIDTNGEADVFHWDRATDALALVSHAAGSAVAAGNGGTSGRLAIADDAVAFLSRATNLVAGATDTNGAADAFFWRRPGGTTRLVSHTSGSLTEGGDGRVAEIALSGDGAILYVAFAGFGRNHVATQLDPDPTTSDVFVFSEQTGSIVLASRKGGDPGLGGANATRPAISIDGRWVAFASADPAIIPGQADTGSGPDVFYFDRLGGGTQLVSHAAGAPLLAGLPQLGERALAISNDGTAVIYASPAADLVAGLLDTNGGTDLFHWDQSTNRLITRRAIDRPSVTGGGISFVLGRPTAALDAEGRYVAFTGTAIGQVAGQTGFAGFAQVYSRDRSTATTAIASHTSASLLTGGNDLSDAGVASADGRYVAFWSAAGDLVAAQLPVGTVGLYLEDRLDGSLLRVATAPSGKALFDDPSPHALSADGRYLAFVSAATNLVPGQVDGNGGTDVFLFDRVAGTTVLVSHASGAPTTAANAPSGYVSLDAAGRFLAFESLGSNVSPGQFDNQGFLDVFVWDRTTGVADLVSRAFDTPNGPAVGPSHAPEISANGRWIAFRSEAFDLVPSQIEGNVGEDVFLFDRIATTNLLVSRQAGTIATTGNAPCTEARPNGDGRYIAFACRASDLVAGATDTNAIPDLFVFDRNTGTSALASHASGNPFSALGIDAASPPSISRNGRFVAYASDAALSPGQTGPAGTNIFLFDRASGTNTLASRAATAPTQGQNGLCLNPQVSADGGLVVFASTGDDLVADDRNRALDVFAFRNTAIGRYFTLPPCRLYDSRSDGAGPLASGVPRLRAAHSLCGVPTTATAIAANVTVTAPTALGFLTLYSGDASQPGVATLNFGAGQTRTNNALVRLAIDGSGTYAASAFVLGSGTVEVIVDVAGWFE